MRSIFHEGIYPENSGVGEKKWQNPLPQNVNKHLVLEIPRGETTRITYFSIPNYLGWISWGKGEIPSTV